MDHLAERTVSLKSRAYAELAMHAKQIARGYAALLFCRSTLVGAVFLGVTMYSPSIGLLGLTGAACAYWTGRWLRFSALPELLVCNGALIGLCFGFFYRPTPVVVGATLLAAILVALLCQTLGAWLYRLGRLPLLSLPFLLCAWLALPALRGLEGAIAYAPPLFPGVMLAPELDNFFVAIGSFLFQDNPWAGAVLFAGLAWSSRLLALLAIAGYLAGAICLNMLGVQELEIGRIGYNFVLTAMALGGVYLIPSRTSFVYSLVAVALSAMLAAAFAMLLPAFGLPSFVAPFLFAVLASLAALGFPSSRSSPVVNPDPARLPEESLESARLAAVRNGDPRSVPLLVPFFGEWRVSQGFAGPHTHRGDWRHAADFVITERGRSFRDTGERLEDYFCYGATVIAPASGTIVAFRNDVPDNPPGQLGDRAMNWGNYVLLALPSSAFVLLSHLRCQSVHVEIGQWVTAGQPLAACGNSGRASQPHLHLHVQAAAALGSPTIPFHFVAALTRDVGETIARFRLTLQPMEGQGITGASADARLAVPLQLTQGRWLRFAISEDRPAAAATRELRVEVTLLGQFRLAGTGGASAAFEQTSQVLAFYNRRGSRDALLDTWLLALGLTPFSAEASTWMDEPDPCLFPLRDWEHALAKLFASFGLRLQSRYQRRWSDADGAWVQDGAHELRLCGISHARATTRAWLVPGVGVSRLSCAREGNTRNAVLVAVGAQGDYGVPDFAREISEGGQI